MKKSIIVKLLSLALLPLLIFSCANRYSVSTNLDRENFKHYFSPSKVKIYQDEQSITGKYRYIGSVDGEDCQKKVHHQVPDEVIARTDARRKAFQLGANAIVFTGCALIEKNEANKQCVSTKVCYGKAYQISSNTNE
ncbi:MAG: rcsF protein [Colwelliaceae bacterium]|jgi:RcsF protein|nr:rcsF protein [Colwelliaceae bacterium]